MAKREISSTLKNLKFMQRAAQREENTKKEEEVVKVDDGNFPASGIPRKCIVIMEGDPSPGASKGRMSFQSFNPSIDKLNEDPTKNSQPEASATSSGNESGSISDRENGSSQEGSGRNGLKNDANGDLKRKQVEETASEKRHPNKLQKGIQDDDPQSASPASNNNSTSSHKKKQQKREKLDWSVLRPPKSESKRRG